MVIILFSLCVYRVIWIRLAVPHIPTIDGVYMVYPISWLIGAILMVVYTKTTFPKQASTQNISL
jgi:Na+-driven multidrug efflux pump